MIRRIRLIYLSLIIPFVFVLRLYQIYMNVGLNPFIVDFLREKNLLWIVLLLTIYPVADLVVRTIRELRVNRRLQWDRCFLLIAALIADIQVIVLLSKSLINPINAQYFMAYQLIGLCAYYLGRYCEDELRLFLYIMVGIITVTAVYGLVEWGVYIATQRRLLLSTEWGRLISFYGNPILAGSSLLVGFWLASIIGNVYARIVFKIVIVIAIFATMSRSCWLGLLFSVIVLLISNRAKLKNKRFILIIVGCGCVAIAGILFINPYIQDLIMGRFTNIAESNSYRLRTEYWVFGIKNFFSDTSFLSKLIGTGYTTSEKLITSSEMYSKWKDVLSYDIHFDNVYISILTEFGLVGMISVIITARRAFSILFWAKDRKVQLCCCVAIVGLIPAALFWDPIYCLINMILFIAIAGIVVGEQQIGGY